MDKAENVDLDLVFLCSKSVLILQNSYQKENSLIFKSYFWENVFKVWIQIIIKEKFFAKNQFIDKKKSFSLSLKIIDNEEIANLNQKWLNKSGVTDVISFPIILHNEYAKELFFLELGDLFISLETASKQALEFKHSIKEEMLWLASHGFLHLLGWEHNSEQELKKMLNFQEYLIKKIN